MRVTALVMEGIVNAIYRSLVPMQALAERGHTVHLEEREQIRDPGALLERDVVHITRMYSPEAVRVARRLREAGVALVYDNDDDVSATHVGHEYDRLTRQQILSGITAMVRCAHVVTTPSDAIAERYREMGAEDVRVLPNCLPPIFRRQGGIPARREVILGWLAAGEHKADLKALGLRGILERLLEAHPQLQVIGIGLPLDLRSDRYDPWPITAYGRLPELMSWFDLGIAPLIDTPFNRARSNVKLKEYAAIGAAWLASPVGPYAGMGEAQGGRLVADDRWYEEIERLILDAEARRGLAQRGRAWVRGEYIEAHIDLWESVLEDAVARATAASGAVS
jgi:glycosyltransferase involved in cell wall biosynthesis